MLRPGSAKNFSHYASQVFLPYVASQLQQAGRIDIVWDGYRPDRLKAETRVKRGKGVRRRVEASTPIPGNWQESLRTDENKVELFSFLANRVPCIETEKQVLSTIQSDIVCNQSRNVSRLTPCAHEEADTRTILHLEDAVTEGFNKISIRTVDTDVVVLAVAAAQRHGNTEIWIAFGTGKSFRFLPAHEMARVLGPDRCTALPMFHAFTGCDTVSFFGGRGKRTAWDTWRSYNDITSIFVSLANTPESVESSVTSLERFVILLYDRTSSLEDINQARKHLFAQKGRSIENIPPTKAALVQHIKRAVYQALTSSPDAAGKPTGPHCQKQRWPAENFWGMVPRKVAKRTANAQRLLCSAQLYVNVVDNALKTRIFHGETAVNSMLSTLSITCSFYSW